MKVIVSPGAVKGSLQAPPSKSYGQRALAAALITPGRTWIQNLGNSDDEQAALRVVQQLGATVHQTQAGLEIFSQGVRPVSRVINCGESGLCARLFLPIAALSHQPLILTGRGTLLRRPMKDILALLPALGVQVAGEAGTLPVLVQGTLHPQDLVMDGSLSSQFLSGVLFAFAASATRPVQVQALHLNSSGYARMSVEVLQVFGCSISEINAGCFILRPAPRIPDRHYGVPGDYSSAAPLMLAAALAGKLTIQNLTFPSLQPDAAFLSILQRAGASVSFAGKIINIRKASALHAFDVDATHAPDLFPVLAILASQCRGKSRIKGVHRLVHKESNRAESIGAMLQSFGVVYEIKKNSLIVSGPFRLNAATIDSFQDHRIVMAAAVGALIADGPVAILGAEAVAKSYPAFFDDLAAIGAKADVVQ